MEETYYVHDSFNKKRYGYYDGLSKNEANALKRRIANNGNVGIEYLSVKKVPLEESLLTEAIIHSGYVNPRLKERDNPHLTGDLKGFYYICSNSKNYESELVYYNPSTKELAFAYITSNELVIMSEDEMTNKSNYLIPYLKQWKKEYSNIKESLYETFNVSEEFYGQEEIWTKEEVNALIRDLKSEGEIGDNEAFDIAEGILADEPGLKKYIVKVLGIRDPLGWLASRIV
jgi:hypothetical protein